MHLIAKRLCVGVLFGVFALGSAMAAEPPKPRVPFNTFIAKFRAAIVARDRAAVAAMSQLPAGPDGKPMSAAQAAEYVAPFFGRLRLCVLQEKPVQDGESYAIFCGEQGLSFEPVNGEYKFADFFAND